MNLPNKLTIFRIILIPFLLIFILFDFIPLDIQIRRYIATAIFITASLTDALDGHIARKYNLITNFGKFMDPLADKLLVTSTMIALISMQDAIVPLKAWVVILIIAREFFMTGFRTIAMEKNVVIAAGNSGKLKTIFQMFMIIFLLLNIDNKVFIFISNVLIAISVFLTIYSLVEYVIKNKSVLKD
ncbi:CDP-diacylglycerol--glycerol-3-phosphate 3-phosphatidyltransferase [[Clostridium] colinum]|uniref:CDP-diacylglycerol--glycerol-3-phosphate 3-phosphatidyltransferase n=1 Tax=[Clostridium] colinum TaxID=36835 RepID=UPI002023DF48|nr:CDP-diacylglycerol--glycerol-3-phosphate 3-phosphatidyltransferase [[Clostridium] colinum]